MENVENINERWSIIPNYENYEVSTNGEVKNKTTNKIKKGKITKEGLVAIQLFKENKTKMFLIHRLVANAFIPNEDKKKYVLHIDGNKENNKVANLKWITNSERGSLHDKYKTNTTGYKGVYEREGTFKAKIQYKGKGIHIGSFSNAKDAYKAYQKKHNELFGNI